MPSLRSGREIPMDGEIVDIDSTYSQFLTLAGTHRRRCAPRGRRRAATTSRRSPRRVPYDYGSGATSATGSAETDGFVQQAPPRWGDPARLYIGYLDAELGNGPFEERHRQLARYTATDTPTPCASLLFDDERGRPCVVRRARERGSWRAHVWRFTPTTVAGASPSAARGLARRSPSTSLVTSTEEVLVFLDEHARRRTRSVVDRRTPDFPEAWAAAGPRAWRPTDSPTCLSWAVGVVGRRHARRRAVMWDFDDSAARSRRRTIDVAPRGARRTRCLRLPIGDQQPAFAAEQPDGPSVWVGARRAAGTSGRPRPGRCHWRRPPTRASTGGRRRAGSAPAAGPVLP